MKQWQIRSVASSLLLLTLISILFFYQHKNKRPYLTVIGFAEMSDGLGRQSVEIMDTLKDEVSVGYRPTAHPIYQDVPGAVQKIMKKSYKHLGKVILYEDIIHPLSHLFFQKRFNLHKHDQLRLAYSMFESSKIPLRWVHNLNLYFDAVIVPDSYLMETYKNSGVTIPIFVLPLGLNLQPFLQAPLKTSAHTPFIFANFSTCIERKNHRELIYAFYKAFGNNPDVQLWINCKYSREHLFESLEQEVKSLNTSNILLTHHCYPHAEYLQNFQQIDCYVSLSESEGFSIQPREAMALGIPCIVSDNTAQSTICKSGLVLSVPCPTQHPAYYEQFQEILGFRYHVDMDASVASLKEMYEHYPRYLERAQAMREWAGRYDYATLRPLYRSLIKPQQIVLGTMNTITKEGMTTDSPHLYAKYQSVR